MFHSVSSHLSLPDNLHSAGLHLKINFDVGVTFSWKFVTNKRVNNISCLSFLANLRFQILANTGWISLKWKNWSFSHNWYYNFVKILVPFLINHEKPCNFGDLSMVTRASWNDPRPYNRSPELADCHVLQLRSSPEFFSLSPSPTVVRKS